MVVLKNTELIYIYSNSMIFLIDFKSHSYPPRGPKFRSRRFTKLKVSFLILYPESISIETVFTDGSNSEAGKAEGSSVTHIKKAASKSMFQQSQICYEQSCYRRR